MQSDQPADNFFASFASQLIGKNLFILHESDKAGQYIQSQGYNYVDLAFDLHLRYTGLIFSGNPPFVNTRTTFAFTKSFLVLADNLAYGVITNIRNDLWDQIDAAESSYKERVSQVRPKKITEENLEEYSNNLQSIHDETDMVIRKSREEMSNELERLLLQTMSMFIEILKKCDSPLERAFLIGITAYGGNYGLGWAAVMMPGVISCNLTVDIYRLQFAIRNEEMEVRLAIQIDDKDSSREQSIDDDNRNRVLSQMGWNLLIVSREEIEQDLEACVKRVGRIYSDLSS